MNTGTLVFIKGRHHLPRPLINHGPGGEQLPRLDCLRSLSCSQFYAFYCINPRLYGPYTGGAGHDTGELSRITRDD